jgi:hypothetical protein
VHSIACCGFLADSHVSMTQLAPTCVDLFFLLFLGFLDSRSTEDELVRTNHRDHNICHYISFAEITIPTDPTSMLSAPQIRQAPGHSGTLSAWLIPALIGPDISFGKTNMI